MDITDEQIDAFAFAYWPVSAVTILENERDHLRIALAAALSQPAALAGREGAVVTVTYTNYRGETADRTITPKSIWFGSTEWHPEPQWLLLAFDHDKQADRDFALKDFGSPAPRAAGVRAVPVADCEQCQGNGEIVTDWDRYLKPHEGDVGDEAVAECPDCDGSGKVSPAPASPVGEER